jgi:hypothetical protein
MVALVLSVARMDCRLLAQYRNSGIIALSRLGFGGGVCSTQGITVHSGTMILYAAAPAGAS